MVLDPQWLRNAGWLYHVDVFVDILFPMSDFKNVCALVFPLQRTYLLAFVNSKAAGATHKDMIIFYVHRF